MAQKLTKVRIFIATPNELADERRRLAGVVDGLNQTGGTAEELGLTLELLGYDTHAHPDVGRPQQVVFDQLSPESWDIFVGVLWTRFGTDTGARDPETGVAYLSGTEEEFDAALRRRKNEQTGWPKIMFYRCLRPIPPDTDAMQLVRVQEFFKQFEAGGEHPGLVSKYTEPDEFERRVRQHLESAIREYAKKFLVEERPPAPPPAGAADAGDAPAPAQHAARCKVTVPASMLRYLLDRFLPRLHTLLCTRIEFFKLPEEWRPLHEHLSTLHSAIADDIREKTYVEPPAKAAPDDVDRLKPQRTGFLTPIQQVIKEIVGVSHGGDAHSAQISAISRKSKFVGDLVKRLMEADEPLILLGDPGTGKSITLQQAAMLIAERESRRVFPNVCLFVRLGEFRADGHPVSAQTVWDYVKRSAAEEIRPYLDGLDNLGRLVIFFDGMDEMSRERYNEYTRALSVFADSRKARHTKTLFSCRITDFTPRFQHRRLVLLPFGRTHIYKYLTRQLSFPITIGGKPWKAKQLADHLAHGELPMQADNPFVLWLLCTYLQQRGEWPESRVDLLGYYNRYNYERKARDAAEQGTLLLDREAAFLALGRVAYEITERNKGAAIPLAEAEALLGPGGPDAVKAGMHCGVLQTSLDTETTLIRFEHHRFQEYFTAHYLNRNPGERATLNWLDKLDAPRWQETLFNLVLMGGGEEALAALREAVERGRAALDKDDDEYGDETDVDDNDDAGSDDGKGGDDGDGGGGGGRAPRRAAPAYVETQLADRVELASRVLQQTGQRREGAVAGLYATFQDALYWLADRGNPITKVKMLLASKVVPGVNVFRVAREALASNVSWVRQQALIVTSAAGRDVGEGAALREDILHSFASGKFFNRLGGYVRIARALRQRRLWLVLCAGLILSVLQPIACYGVVAAVGAAAGPAYTLAGDVQRLFSLKNIERSEREARKTNDEKKLSDAKESRRTTEEYYAKWTEAASAARDSMNTWWFTLALPLAMLLAFLFSMRRTQGRHLLISLAAGYGVLLLALVWWPLWLGHWSVLFVVLVFMAALFVPLIFILGWAVALAAQGSALALFIACASWWAGPIRKRRTLFEAMWDNNGFRDWGEPLAAYGRLSLMFVGYAAVFLYTYYMEVVHEFLFQVTTGYGLFPALPPVANAFLSIACYLCAVGPLVAAYAARRERDQRLRRWLRLLVFWTQLCAGLALVVLALWGLFSVDWRAVWQFIVANAGLFKSLPPPVNVLLSATVYGEAVGLAAALVSGLTGGSRRWERGFEVGKIWTFACVAVAAVVLLVWGLTRVDWKLVASALGLFHVLPPAVNAALSIAIYAEAVGVVVFVVSLLGGRRVDVWGVDRRKQAVALFKTWTLVCLVLTVLPFVLWGFYAFSDYLARVLAVIITCALALALLAIVYLLVKDITPYIVVLRGPIRRYIYNSETWKQELRALDADYQAALLRRTTPETLDMSVYNFLRLLQEVEGVIKDDPAQSAYWAKRHQIEQIIRQEKTG